jgi:hypothetical protein
LMADGGEHFGYISGKTKSRVAMKEESSLFKPTNKKRPLFENQLCPVRHTSDTWNAMNSKITVMSTEEIQAMTQSFFPNSTSDANIQVCSASGQLLQNLPRSHRRHLGRIPIQPAMVPENVHIMQWQVGRQMQIERTSFIADVSFRYGETKDKIK